MFFFFYIHSFRRQMWRLQYGVLLIRNEGLYHKNVYRDRFKASVELEVIVSILAARSRVKLSSALFFLLKVLSSCLGLKPIVFYFDLECLLCLNHFSFLDMKEIFFSTFQEKWILPVLSLPLCFDLSPPLWFYNPIKSFKQNIVVFLSTVFSRALQRILWSYVFKACIQITGNIIYMLDHFFF